MGDSLAGILAAQREYRWAASASTAEQRVADLLRLRKSVIRHAPLVQAALTADMGKPVGEPYAEELALVLRALDHTVEHLAEWMRPVDVPPLDPAVRSAQIRYEARGVCLLFGPWNFPFLLLFEPLVAIVSAGNTAIVKPNEVAPATSAVSARIIREVFDERHVAVVEGGVDLANRLLELPVDHVFFTGSPAVGKVVMAAAARHLASVTLELGGKCPAVVDRSADLAAAAAAVAAGRHSNGGQICLACDHVWVHRDVKEEFLTLYDAWVDENLCVDGEVDPSTMSRIIDDRNLARVNGYLEDARARGAVFRRGGSESSYPGWLQPTVVEQLPPDALLMTEEIFAPILPVQVFDTLDELVRPLREMPKPLAMYVYARDDAFLESLLARTTSGGVTVNGWGSHWGEMDLPFGGVNTSGIGAYHGIHGFRELSHARSVVVNP